MIADTSPGSNADKDEFAQIRTRLRAYIATLSAPNSQPLSTPSELQPPRPGVGSVRPSDETETDQIHARLRAYIATFPPRESQVPLYIPFGLKPTRPSMTPPLCPAAIPTAAGITEGFKHLVDDDKPLTRAEMRQQIKRLKVRVKQLDAQAADLMLSLAGRIEALERQVRKGRAA